MAVGRVEQVISIRGQNDAGKSIEEAKRGLSGLREAAGTVAERSGDLERGFRGVKDIVGKVAGVDLGPLTDQFGGIEAVIKGFGGALSPFTIGLAAAGAAAFYIYAQTEKVRKAAIDAKIKEVQIAKEDASELAKKLGISKELLGVTDTLATAEQIQSEAKDRANKLADTQVQILEAQKEKENDKIQLLRIEEGRLKLLLIQDETRLAFAKQAAREQDQFNGEQERAKRKIASQEDVINSNLNFRDRMNLRAQARQEKFNELKLEEAKIEYALNMGAYDREKREKRLTEIYNERKKLSSEELGDAQQVQSKRDQSAAKAKQYAQDERAAVAALAQARADAAAALAADEQKTFQLQMAAIAAAEQAEIKAARQSEGTQIAKAAKIEAIQLQARAKEDKLRDEVIAREAERQKQSEEGAKRVAEAQIAAADQFRKAQIGATTDPAAKAELQIADLRIEAQRKINEARAAGFLSAQDLAVKEQAINTELANSIAATEKTKQDAITETAQKQKEAVQKTIDASADTVAAAASVVASYQGKNGLGTALVETTKQIKSVSAGWQDNKANSAAVIGAVGNVAAAFVKGEREKAGILAIMETAQAVAYALTPGKQAMAIAHGAAAALYGSIALGVISGGSGTPTVPGGGGFAAGGGATSSGGSTGQAGATVINFNAPLGTAYEIGKSVVKAQKAAGSSGWSPNMAMGV